MIIDRYKNDNLEGSSMIPIAMMPDDQYQPEDLALYAAISITGNSVLDLDDAGDLEYLSDFSRIPQEKVAESAVRLIKGGAVHVVKLEGHKAGHRTFSRTPMTVGILEDEEE